MIKASKTIALRGFSAGAIDLACVAINDLSELVATSCRLSWLLDGGLDTNIEVVGLHSTHLIPHTTRISSITIRARQRFVMLRLLRKDIS